MPHRSQDPNQQYQHVEELLTRWLKERRQVLGKYTEIAVGATGLLDEAGRAQLDVGPAPRPGSGATVNSTGYSLDDFVQRWGATFRLLVDVGDWDRSLAMNSPGQSGDPASSHYRDLFQPWARDEAFPLLFSRERVEAAAESRLRLRPAP